MASMSFICLHVLLLLLPESAQSMPNEYKHRVDLTHILEDGIPEGPGFRGFVMNVTYNRSLGNFTVQSERLDIPTHLGTHMDAPVHFNESGWTVDAIPPDRLSGTGVVVDIRNKTETNASYALTERDLLDWEKAHGRIPDRAFVLVLTGHSRFWNDTSRYFGTDTKDFTKFRFPGLSGEAADFLVRERDVLGVGVDSLSLDAAPSARQAHLALLGANRIALENLDNLDKLPNTGIQVEVVPMKIRGASGAPANVLVYF